MTVVAEWNCEERGHNWEEIAPHGYFACTGRRYCTECDEEEDDE